MSNLPKLPKLLILLSALLLLPACQYRSAQEKLQRQASADAIAGVDAITDFDETAIGRTVKQFILIAAGLADQITNADALYKIPSEDLPPPQMSADQIKANPQQYAKDAQRLADESMSIGAAFAWAGGILGGVFALARMIPGGHTPFVAMAESLLSGRKDKQKRQKERQAANTLDDLHDTIAVLTQAIEASGDRGIKQTVAKNANGAVQAILDPYVAEVELPSSDYLVQKEADSARA